LDYSGKEYFEKGQLVGGSSEKQASNQAKRPCWGKQDALVVASCFHLDLLSVGGSSKKSFKAGCRWGGRLYKLKCEGLTKKWDQEGLSLLEEERNVWNDRFEKMCLSDSSK